jgi:hypothetical protein
MTCLQQMSALPLPGQAHVCLIEGGVLASCLSRWPQDGDSSPLLLGVAFACKCACFQIVRSQHEHIILYSTINASERGAARISGLL